MQETIKTVIVSNYLTLNFGGTIIEKKTITHILYE